MEQTGGGLRKKRANASVPDVLIGQGLIGKGLGGE
jgi:hypothetical protein